MVRPSGNLIIGGRLLPTDAPIVNFREGPRWDATLESCTSQTICRAGVDGPDAAQRGPRRYGMRPQLGRYGANPPFEAARHAIKQVIVHHGGAASAEIAFQILHDVLGLSMHFVIDVDGMIYQTCDLGLMAFHAAAWNPTSIGILLCSRRGGDATKYPDYQPIAGEPRQVRAVRVNGQTIRAYDFTSGQYESMMALGRVLLRLLPEVSPTFPQASPGRASWSTLPHAVARTFSGFLGHYHLSARHWDPGPFDFAHYCEKLAGTVGFPVALGPAGADLARPIYEANERTDGGFFPVGPWGASRLWHGGIHVPLAEGTAVHAPFPGRIVLARMGEPGPAGSTSFVLIRHELSLGPSRVRFFTLYMHLADETKQREPAGWVAKQDAKQGVFVGSRLVLMLDEPVAAGDVIGHAGKAGPAEMSRGQVHLELFSTTELFADASSPWRVVDGTSGGRFCEVPEINALIDADRDGKLSHDELAAFYRAGHGRELRDVVTLHVSEWTADPSWADALRLPKDFRDLRPQEIDELVENQITPTLWWDDKTAAHCNLPANGIVYHYHPIRFIEWWLAQLAADTDADVDPMAYMATTLEDALDTGSDMYSSDCAPLALEDLLLGADAPRCGKR